MKITVFSHDLSSNASMRAHRLACAARAFAEVALLGPARKGRLWPALPAEPWMPIPSGGGLPTWGGVFNFSSRHPTLVNFAYFDGSVRPLKKPAVPGDAAYDAFIWMSGFRDGVQADRALIEL